MQICLLDVAQNELDEAVVYHNAQSPGLGDQFLIEVLAAFDRIRKFPKAWHPYTNTSLRCQTQRFPYSIVYQTLETEILIVAIAHMHRKPGYWSDRIKKL